MNIIKVDSYEELSAKAADMILSKVRNNPKTKLGLATGGTPLGAYELIIQDHLKNGTSFQDIITVNLDEYVGLDAKHHGSYRYYMDEQFLNHINIKKENAHLPDGTAKDLNSECREYEAMIDELGGMDLQLLGIGENGHIGFNEPGTAFDSVTHVVELTPSTREVNARFFNHLDEVPTNAITMGISSILKSKEILLLVSGEKKANAMKELLNGEPDVNFPASALKTHPHFTVICDKDALK